MHRLTHSLKRAMAFQTNIEGQADTIYDIVEELHEPSARSPLHFDNGGG